jgi:hypothetical protein
MKTLAVFLTLAGAALASPEQAARERLNTLPQDAGAHYLTFFVQAPEQVAQMIAVYPRLAELQHQTRFNVYQSGDPLYIQRYSNVPVPSAVLQRADGAVVWSTTHFLRPERNLWRRGGPCPWNNSGPDEEPPPRPPGPDPAPGIPVGPIPTSGPVNAMIPLLLALLYGAAGAGTEVFEEFKQG